MEDLTKMRQWKSDPSGLYDKLKKNYGVELPQVMDFNKKYEKLSSEIGIKYVTLDEIQAECRCYKLFQNDQNILWIKEILRWDDLNFLLIVRNEKFTNLTDYSEFLNAKKILDEEEILVQLIYFCRAYKKVREQKLIHRDLKPNNLSVNKFFQIVIIDFGTAKEDLRKSTQYGFNKTADYTPPEAYILNEELREQLFGKEKNEIYPYDEKAEMWALAATLVELLEGNCAFSIEFSKKNGTGNEIISNKEKEKEQLENQLKKLKEIFIKYPRTHPLHKILAKCFIISPYERLFFKELCQMDVFTVGLYSVSKPEKTITNYKKLIQCNVFDNIELCETKARDLRKNSSNSFEYKSFKTEFTLMKIGIHMSLIYRRKLFLIKGSEDLKKKLEEDIKNVEIKLSEFHEKLLMLDLQMKDKFPEHTSEKSLSSFNIVLHSLTLELYDEIWDQEFKNSIALIGAYSLIDLVDCEDKKLAETNKKIKDKLEIFKNLQ